MSEQTLARDFQNSHSVQTLNLESWKIEISAANNAFIHGQHANAFTHYQATLEIAEIGVAELLLVQKVEMLIEAERQVAALVVTRHNLADLFRQAGQLTEAVEHLCEAHESLFKLLHHANSDVQILAQRHSRITYQELMSFTQRHGKNSRIQQSLLLTKFVCECCRQKVSH